MKNWYQSKTIWGVIISLLGIALHRHLPDISSEIVQVIGLVLAAYGRFVAEVKLK